MNWFFMWGMIAAFIAQIVLNATVLKRMKNQDRMMLRHQVLIHAMILHLPDGMREHVDKQLDAWMKE